MRTRHTILRFLLAGAVFATLTLVAGEQVDAQGSVFGVLRNADLSVPADGEIHFLGFIDDTDNELRIHTCIGAGYESGNWYDDFQNYLGEAPGMAYRYYFFNPTSGEAALLDDVIPNNSFEQQDITLAPATFPAPAEDAWAAIEPGGQVRLAWTDVVDVTWHVYRRIGNSEGSFFRIDNPFGDRADPGVSDPFFVDTDVIDGECYNYILVTESAAGDYSPATAIIQIDLSSCCQGQVGDVNGVGGDEPTIGDVALLIDHLFISMTDPDCYLEADVNQSGGPAPVREDISISDVALLIDHLFISGVPLFPCLNSTR